MTREALARKIGELRVGGDTKFVVSNNHDYFEFKLVELCGKEYILLGASDSVIGIYMNGYYSDDIVDEFALYLEQIEAKIESCVFESTYYFN